MAYKYLQEVREDVVCKCGERWLHQATPFRWVNGEYPKHQAGMEEITVPHRDDEGDILHLQIHKCWCGATIMVLLRTEEDTITAGHMEVYPSHEEVRNENFLEEGPN